MSCTMMWYQDVIYVDGISYQDVIHDDGEKEDEVEYPARAVEL